MPGSIHSSVPEVLADAARRAPLQIALEHDGKRLTYARFTDSVARLARGLHELGVRRGQRVAIISGMRSETVIAFHAAVRIGAVAVLHDAHSTSRELRRAFEDHAAVLAIVDPEAQAAVNALPADLHPKAVIAMEEHRPRAYRLRHAVHVPRIAVRRLSVSQFSVRQLSGARLSMRRLRPPPRERQLASQRVIPWRDLAASAPLDSTHPMPRSRDLALLQYTIGRDGELLGAMLTHGNLVADAQHLAHLWRDGEGEPAMAQVVCATVPLHETTGASAALLAAPLHGHHLVLTESVDDVLDSVRRSRLTILTGTPALLVQVAARALEGEVNLGTLRRAVALLPGMPTQAADAWAVALGHPVDVAYVRAECGVALGGLYDSHAPGGLGDLLDGVQVRIGPDHELRIAGAQVFHGYWNRPDETALALSGDGWVRTGDEVLPASDCVGVLIGSRRREIIRADGRIISPREVAAILRTHPDVVAAVVDGVAQPEGGELVRAHVVLSEGAATSPDSLRDFVAERLSPAKVPEEIVTVQDLREVAHARDIAYQHAAPQPASSEIGLASSSTEAGHQSPLPRERSLSETPRDCPAPGGLPDTGQRVLGVPSGMARYLEIHPVDPQPRLIEQAVHVLREGGLIAYPTDSCYALGCSLDNKDALERIRTIRQVGSQHDFTLVCADFAQLAQFVIVSNPVFRLVKNATPGPYTFILPATKEVPRRMAHPRKHTVGVRIPENNVARALVQALGEPIVSSTLLLPGQEEPPTEGWMVQDLLDSSLDAIIEAGDVGTEPTTVVDLSSGEVEIRREGAGDVDRF